MRLDVVPLLLAAETVFMVGIICRVAYTEIDWTAYMEEVGGFLGGELDYAQLKGGTGPLVYPGGFVWLFSAFYYLTRQGAALAVAQSLFLAAHLITWALALRLYTTTGILRVGVVVSLFLSKRIRSLFVLRLFNDCWAMLFAYAAVWVFASNTSGAKRQQQQQQRHGRGSQQRGRLSRWLLGCVLYSAAVSIKMNVFLFAPGLLYVLLRCLPLARVALCLAVCAVVQLVAGAPFLATHPASYLRKAFELSRVFMHRWSVNLQYVPEPLFVRPELGAALLAATVLLWGLALRLRWRHRRFGRPATATISSSSDNNINNNSNTDVAQRDDTEDDDDAAADDDEFFRSVVLTLLESNLIGVLLSRSLHYQFYTWFFHTTPLVMAYTRLPLLLQVGTCAVMRIAFEKYPPTPRNSLLFLAASVVALAGVLFGGVRDEAAVGRAKKKATDAAAAADAAVASEKKSGGGITNGAHAQSQQDVSSGENLTRKKKQ